MHGTTMYTTTRSGELFPELEKVLVNGVGSDERSGIKPYPISMSHGRGSHIFDIDGNEYIDYLIGYGALIQGHCPRSIIEAVKEQLERGTIFGAPHELELSASKKIIELVPSIEMVRYDQSGSEAVLAALRTARAFTGKTKIIKFEGHYHGWFDQLDISHLADSLDTLGPYDAPASFVQSAGQSDAGVRDMIVIPWNDVDILEKTIKAHKNELAAVISEPIMLNASCIMPLPGYLEAMRRLTAENEIVLIFDEVHTGFRIGLHGAQGYLGVTPDMTVLAKAIGAGYPVSCFGGRREIMEGAVKNGVRHAGTYNSNPLVLAAVDANLKDLARDNGTVYERTGRLASRLRQGLKGMYERAGWPARDQGAGMVFGINLLDRNMTGLRDLFRCDTAPLAQLRSELRRRGIYTRPALRDLWYLSAAHTDQDIDRTLQAVEDALRLVKH